MNRVKLAVLSLVLGSGVSLAGECVRPEVPSLPDGGSASMEDMLAGQKAVKTFQTANLEYMSCLERDMKKAEEATLKGSKDEMEAAQSNYQAAVERYNAAVSQEEEVAGQFNTEIREYKAANPG
ncbi:MAG: hypothetical protein KDI16_08035 [Halioglobus sp.]|nr:hypothetical protein [Halioglobus sp.]